MLLCCFVKDRAPCDMSTNSSLLASCMLQGCELVSRRPSDSVAMLHRSGHVLVTSRSSACTAGGEIVDMPGLEETTRVRYIVFGFSVTSVCSLCQWAFLCALRGHCPRHAQDLADCLRHQSGIAIKITCIRHLRFCLIHLLVQ